MRAAWTAKTPEQKKAVYTRSQLRRDPRQHRDYQLKRDYGISIEQYEDLLREQGGVCALKHHDNIKRLVVDHCHETGKVRGILCYDCNRLMSLLDNEDRYKAALEYKKRSQYE